jgi:EAL domain-containing protein (putative c-di-GMP-specific phosphodiesterase class I)
MVAMAAIPDDRVVVIHADPDVVPEQLVPATFAAAVTAFGARAICDVADGPHGSVLVHISGDTPASGLLRQALHTALVEQLAGSFGLRPRVEVQVLGDAGGAGGVVREMALQWIQRAGPDSFLSSRGNPYDAAIRELFDGEQMRIVFQPIVEAWSGRVIGFEALCRGPVGHILEMPDAFFDALGRSSMQTEAHLQLIEAARRQATEVLPDSGLLLFINTPADEHWPIVEATIELFSAVTWPWTQIVLEVTEKTPVRNKQNFAGVLEWGRAAGVRFALDDVGAGYSGLSSYALLQPEFTKVDMGLVRNCDSDPTRRAIIASLVTLAHRTGSQVVAEGVETSAELETVRWLGVDHVQGFLVAAPTEAPTVLQHPWLISSARRTARR